MAKYGATVTFVVETEHSNLRLTKDYEMELDMFDPTEGGFITLVVHDLDNLTQIKLQDEDNRAWVCFVYNITRFSVGPIYTLAV